MSESQQACRQGPHGQCLLYGRRPPKPVSKMEVDYKDGTAAHLGRTGQPGRDTQRSPPPDWHRHHRPEQGAAQEQIVANIGPPTDPRSFGVAAQRLPPFKLSSWSTRTAKPGKLKSVILTYRSGGGMSQPAIAFPPTRPVAKGDAEPEPATRRRKPQPEMQPQQEGQGPTGKIRPRKKNPPPAVKVQCRRERPSLVLPKGRLSQNRVY